MHSLLLKAPHHPRRVPVPALRLLVQADLCEPPFNGASSEASLPAYRLKQFDESNPSKITSQAATPPRSVVGIGGKGNALTLLSIPGVFQLKLLCSGEAGLF